MEATRETRGISGDTIREENKTNLIGTGEGQNLSDLGVIAAHWDRRRSEPQ